MTKDTIRSRSGLEELTFSEVMASNIIGVEHQCLREWINRGFIKIDENKKLGQGHPTRLTFEDLVKIGTVKALIRIGFRRAAASGIVYPND